MADATIEGPTAVTSTAAPTPVPESVFEDGDTCLIVSSDDGHELISHQGFVSAKDAKAWAAENRPGLKAKTFSSRDEALAAYDRLSKES